MRISPKQFEQVMAVYRNQMQKTPEKTETGRKDSLSLSGDAKAINEVRDLLKFTPEVRQERIDEIKKAIENGEYKVDGQKVAEKMLQHMAVDRFLGEND